MLRVILENQNIKDGFSELVLGFWNWVSNLIRFKDANDSISSSKEIAGSSWCHLAMLICKLPSLDIPNKPFLRNKVLD